MRIPHFCETYTDSGLKSDTDSSTCVIVTVCRLNDADGQILKIFKK